MKEASGEANLTVVAIILIGVIAAVATPLIKSMVDNTKKDGCCMSAGGYKDTNGNCVGYNDASYNECMGIKSQD